MDFFQFFTVSAQSIGIYDCGADFQNLVCLWISDGDDVSEEVKDFDAKGVMLTPNEARAAAAKLIEFANYCDSVEVKGKQNG